MSKKTCLITGSTSGIGRETARRLSKKGFHVIIHGRDSKKGNEVQKEIKEKSESSSVDLFTCDLSKFDDLREMARRIKENYDKLHVLINNAGMWTSKRRLNKKGIEMTFAVNHLSHFLLTHLLMNNLKKSTPARIINVTSDVHRRASINFDGFKGSEGPSGYKAYKQSKLANVLFTFELANRLTGMNISANCLHPGAVRTGLGRNHTFLKYIWRWFPFFKEPKAGAETNVYLASSAELEGVTGKYFVDKEIKDPSPKAHDPELRERLWNISEKMTDINKNLIL